MCRMTTEAKPGTDTVPGVHLNPQAALLYLDLPRGQNSVPDRFSISFGTEVYHPVCRAYGVPVVSVRNAIWPDNAPPRPGLWDTYKGPHPTWSGHQLITDILAFAWTVAANQSLLEIKSHMEDPDAPVSSAAMGALPPQQNTTTSVQDSPYLFESAGSNELNVCPGGKYLSSKGYYMP